MPDAPITYKRFHLLNPIFVIPARGGSKGIPDKNIIDLGGKPLIAYSLQNALDAIRAINDARAVNLSPAPYCSQEALKRIIVSTDSPRIAEVAEQEGVPVPFLRPHHLATDTAGSREVILHAMDFATAQGIDYDCVVLLQPTSPFRTTDDILGAMELYSPDSADMVVSVCQASSNPYYNCFETDATTGYLHISKGDGLYTRRQDAPKAWEYNGAVYVINPDSLRKMAMGAFPRRIPFEMTADHSLDIDTPLDLTVARAILS